MTIKDNALSLSGKMAPAQARAVRDTLFFARLFANDIAKELSAGYTDNRGGFLLYATGQKILDFSMSLPLSENTESFGTPVRGAQAYGEYLKLRERVGNNHHFCLMYDPSSALGSDKFPTLGYCFLKHPMFNQNLQLAEVQKENAEKLQKWKDDMNNQYTTHTCMFDFNKGVSLLSQLAR